MLTVTPEELAIREALELSAALREHLGIATVAAIMNRTPAPLFSKADMHAIAELGAHFALAQRRERERTAAGRARKEFIRAGVPMIELEMLYRPAMGRPEIAELGAVLAAEMPRAMNRLDLAGCKLAICLGPGGVGKTTISAALAIDSACSGRAVDVMTVDPAPRLLDALGLDAGASEPREVDLDSVAHAARAGAARAAARAAPRSAGDFRRDRSPLRRVARRGRSDYRGADLCKPRERLRRRRRLHGDGEITGAGRRTHY